MSTLAAARADNFYYGTDYDGAKHGSLNKFRGSNGALGARANRRHEGILVVRFEMPYKCICLQCGNYIAKGVRFNAQKKKIGEYYSTAIYSFAMRCYFCPQQFVVKTDPQNCRYVCASGLREKIEYTEDNRSDLVLGSGGDDGVSSAIVMDEPASGNDDGLRFFDQDDAVRTASHPMLRLEKQSTRAEAHFHQRHQVLELLHMNEERRHDDYSSNSVLRSDFRKRKREEEEAARNEDELKNFAVPLVGGHCEEDLREAQLAFEGNKSDSSAEKGYRRRWNALSRASAHQLLPANASAIGSLSKRQKRLQALLRKAQTSNG